MTMNGSGRWVKFLVLTVDRRAGRPKGMFVQQELRRSNFYLASLRRNLLETVVLNVTNVSLT